jgi:DNA-binding XRE family transcriptional regulator
MKMTVTFNVPGEISVERGTRVAEEWMAEKTGVPVSELRVLRVQCEDDTPAEPPPPKPDELSAGGKIRVRRHRLGLTQQELAELAGVASNTVSAIERDVNATQGPARTCILDALRRAEGRSNRGKRR